MGFTPFACEVHHPQHVPRLTGTQPLYPMSKKIPLHISNDRAYIWDAEDARNIRENHHITGALVGTLPSVAQQNVFLGLPLLLMPEEAVYLVEKGVAVMLDDAHAHHLPTSEEVDQWREDVRTDRENRLQAQAAARKAKEQKTEKNLSEAALRKRREREEKKTAKLLAAASADRDGNELLTPGDNDPQTPPATRSGARDETGHTIIIPATASDHPWFQPQIYETVQEAKEAGIWSCPSTPLERAKCAVFKDLIQKGYFLGGGMKFGGDWLVYPGDQLRYHSHFVATVLATPLSKMNPMEIVAHGRLGTGTKKAHLICGWDEEQQHVDYYSIEWANFG
ncbi:tRNA-splicing endonuclease subunit [Tulasnella sp. 418]|nr:tRNA-splicing endonuclease subunit [Tulasnella sp. 418]